MGKQRQDSWTKDEDMMLTEIVLRHIRNGRTQLEAFKQAGQALSRTPAACGFRWNATIRNEYSEAIDLAKSSRKQATKRDNTMIVLDEEERQMITLTIDMLEKIKLAAIPARNKVDEATLKRMQQLQVENRELKREINRYREMQSMKSMVNLNDK